MSVMSRKMLFAGAFGSISVTASRMLAVAHATTPYLSAYTVDGDTMTKWANPTDLPSTKGSCIAMNPAATLLVMGLDGSPYFVIYRINADKTLTKLTNPNGMSAYGSVWGVAFSPDGSKLALGVNASPYIVVYNVSGEALTKIGDPTVLPAGASRGVAFNTDGSKLAVTHANKPFITVYNVSVDTLTKISGPSTRPTGIGFGVAFSKN